MENTENSNSSNYFFIAKLFSIIKPNYFVIDKELLSTFFESLK